MQTAESHLKRPWRQFSLRALLGIVFLCSVVLAFWITLVQPYRKEARIIAQLREHGAVVTTRAQAPAWWRNIAGDDFCQRIVQFEADGPKTGDADLELLASAPRLRVLILGPRCRITADGLRSLQKAPELTFVMIDNDAITNDALSNLVRIPNLARLSLGGRFSDDGLSALARRPELTALGLVSPNISDAGLAYLSPLTGLEELVLGGRFSDQGMTHLATLTRLAKVQCWDPAKLPLSETLRNSTQFEFDSVPLIDAAAFLADYHQIAIELDRDELRRAGRDPMLPLTASISNQTFRDALDQLLTTHGVGWKVGEAGLVITSREAGDKSRGNTLALRKKLPKLSLQFDW